MKIYCIIFLLLLLISCAKIGDKRTVPCSVCDTEQEKNALSLIGKYTEQNTGSSSNAELQKLNMTIFGTICKNKPVIFTYYGNGIWVPQLKEGELIHIIK